MNIITYYYCDYIIISNPLNSHFKIVNPWHIGLSLWRGLCNHLRGRSCASIVADQFASCSDTRAPWSVSVAMLRLACLIGCEVKPSNLIPEIHTGLTSNQSCTWKDGIIHCWGLALRPQRPSWGHFWVVAVEQSASSSLAEQRKAAQAYSAFFTLECFISSIPHCHLSLRECYHYRREKGRKNVKGFYV